MARTSVACLALLLAAQIAASKPAAAEDRLLNEAPAAVTATNDLIAELAPR